LPAEIYWRRRLLAMAAVIALIWAVLQVAGGDDKPAAGPTPSVTTTTPTMPTVAPVNGTVTVSLVSTSRPCDPEKIRITPTVTPGQLTKGPVAIGLVVSSTETTACTLTPDAADLLAVISANKTAIWDSTVCKVALLADPVAISPRWASLVTAEWSGRGSGGKCSPKEGYASSGTYSVQVGTLGGEPGRTTFVLERRPAPKPTATPTPTPTPTKTSPTAKNTTKPAG
jgi:hypothetical protein